jgi:hypothetical protein
VLSNPLCGRRSLWIGSREAKKVKGISAEEAVDAAEALDNLMDLAEKGDSGVIKACPTSRAVANPVTGASHPRGGQNQWVRAWKKPPVAFLIFLRRYMVSLKQNPALAVSIMSRHMFS